MNYFFPDLKKGALVHDGRFFKIKPIIAIVGDYTWFEQDETSLGQVGEQEDTPDLRAARGGLLVTSKGSRKWIFTLTADYQEQRTREDVTWQIYDLKVEIPFGPVKLTLGKQKEPFSFEMVGLFPTLPPAGADPVPLLRHPKHRRAALGPDRQQADDLGGGRIQRLA